MRQILLAACMPHWVSSAIMSQLRQVPPLIVGSQIGLVGSVQSAYDRHIGSRSGLRSGAASRVAASARSDFMDRSSAASRGTAMSLPRDVSTPQLGNAATNGTHAHRIACILD